jgi:hypothetical protein
LSFTEELENGATTPFGETVNLVSLFSCRGAVSDQLSSGDDIEDSFANRLANAEALTERAPGAGWNVLRPQPPLSSGIVLLQSPDSRVRKLSPDELRRRLLKEGIAATVYRSGIVRLSMPALPWAAPQLECLMKALRSVVDRNLGTPSPV